MRDKRSGKKKELREVGKVKSGKNWRIDRNIEIVIKKIFIDRLMRKEGEERERIDKMNIEIKIIEKIWIIEVLDGDELNLRDIIRKDKEKIRELIKRKKILKIELEEIVVIRMGLR